MERAGQVDRSPDGDIPQSTSFLCFYSSQASEGGAHRGQEVGVVTSTGLGSNASWARNLLRGKTVGLFGAVAAVASSLVVVLGLVSIPAANAAPYRTHAVDGGATKSSLVSPHTPADSTAPLNSVVSEVYTGDNAPIVTESTPDLPTLSLNGADQNVLISTWNSSFLVLNSASTPIVAGQTYGDPASQGVTQADVSIKVGAYQCGSVYSDVTIDQLVVVGGVVETLALQFDCFDQPGNSEFVGTIAYNASPSTPGQGYYLYGAAGELAGFGNDEFLNYLGDLTTVNLNQPIVGMATTPSDGGYWMVATDGGIFSYGDAQFYGSTGNIRLNKPIVGMASTADGKGYWMVASDGGIFSFGDAEFYGSTGAIHLNKPIVGMASTPDGKGYWLVASDGGIFTFGDAAFYGSTGAIRLNQPIVGMASTPSGNGYWLVAADGGIFTFGDAPFFGSTGNIRLNSPIVGMTPAPDGGGYWFTASDGGVFSFGDAPFAGSLGGTETTDVVGMAR